MPISGSRAAAPICFRGRGHLPDAGRRTDGAGQGPGRNVSDGIAPGGANVFENETQHQVTLTQDYYLGKTAVTQQQWEAVMEMPMRTDCGDIAVGDEIPVYRVTWNRIVGRGGFLEKLNAHLEMDVFRLPTEAEWERAAGAQPAVRPRSDLPRGALTE